MTIKLYNNKSEKNKVNKDIAEIISLSGTLRKETSISSPVVLIESTNSNILTSNYAYIQEFNRYYFIVDITVVNKKLYQFTMMCDVLMSFKEQFLNLDAIISRQENLANLYIQDSKQVLYQYSTPVIKNFSGGFSGESYILIIQGGQKPEDNSGQSENVEVQNEN